MLRIFKYLLFFILVIVMLWGGYQCQHKIFNNPYPQKQAEQNIIYGSFSARPKTLDPAKSYSSDEYVFTNQIYEPPLQYHYLKRPYLLIPLTATALPQVDYYDAQNHLISLADNKVAYSVYTIHIKPGIFYQPHPALAKDLSGHYLYHHLTTQRIHTMQDFKVMGTRELVAADYIYQIKRLADPKNQSPIYGLMSDYIVGLKPLNQALTNAYRAHAMLDLRDYPLTGVTEIGKYTYQIKVKGANPQFIYWLAMPFFAPMPWEADVFYGQAKLTALNMSLDWFPLGTGAYMLTKNNPNRIMVLEKNPHFHKELYPNEGMPPDRAAGLLDDANKPLPLVDKIIFSLEKEFIPRWNKFLQGYYDSSGIDSDSFDQAINITTSGEAALTPAMREQGIYLRSSVMPSIFYTGFNMLDSVVGGDSERARKLRLAISIAIDNHEYITIFLNGRAVVAQQPIPPNIEGGKIDDTTYNQEVFVAKDHKYYKKSLDVARQLLAEAGYPDGRDSKTGVPLILSYDVPISNSPDAKANSDWLRKQFAKLGIQLNINETQYNRFQEKLRLGDSQLYSFGWHADYPDPGNFLFLFYGPNGEVKYGGANSSNYANKEYDRLFEQMQNMPDSPQRLLLIKQMVKILQHDAPWVWGFFPKNFGLYHQWVMPLKIMSIGDNSLKYRRIDPILREKLRKQWNRPVLWPLWLLLVLIIIVAVPIYFSYRNTEYKPPRKLG